MITLLFFGMLAVVIFLLGGAIYNIVNVGYFLLSGVFYVLEGFFRNQKE